MRFFVVESVAAPDLGSETGPCVFLRRLAWDDFGHQTLHEAELVRLGHAPEPLGLVKVACLGPDRAELDHEFEALGEDFCSLGQSWDYYRRAHHLGIRDELVGGLRDLGTISGEARARAEQHPVVAQSLLRLTTARHALARCLGEGPGPYQFTVAHKVEGFQEPHRVEFNFDTQRIGGRAVVLVGENGTGKTRLLMGLVRSVLGVRQEVMPGSKEPTLVYPSIAPRFSFILMLSFSAFDSFWLPRFPIDGHHVKYAGLRHRDLDWSNHSIVSLNAAFGELEAAHRRLQALGRTKQWEDALEEHGLRRPNQKLRAWLDTHSAGQQFIFFTLTHLHAYIDEQALILFDEPEIHSHPAMLSLLMRQLRQLLETFDAFAIVATHSPIVLQETPAQQVRVFRRQGGFPLITRYPGECFAEDLNEIVRRGFGLDEDDHNYKKLLERLVQSPSHGVEQIRRELERMGLAGYLALEELSGERE